MQTKTLHKKADRPTIALPFFSGHRRAWIGVDTGTPGTTSAERLAVTVVLLDRRPRKIGRWILALALAATAGWLAARGASAC